MALTNLTKVQTVGIGSNIEVVGVVTTGQFKSGTSNLHSTGVELTNLNVSGIATIGGNLSIGGTLTYQDVTNVDSVGIITAQAGINVSGGQLDVGSNIKIGNAGVITATTFVGNLTGAASALSPSVFASGPFNNRIVTTTGGNNLNPEISLQFDGTSTLELQPTSATPAIFVGDSNRTGAGQHLTEYRGNWNGTLVGRIIFAAGDDTTNKDDGIITMHTTPSGGSSTERLRITSDGGTVVNKGGSPTAASGWAGLEVKASSSQHQLVLSSTSNASNSNYAKLGFKLHPSNDNERVKAAIVCQGSGGGYGEVSRMMFCLDNVGDNGSAEGNGADEKMRIYGADGRVRIGQNDSVYGQLCLNIPSQSGGAALQVMNTAAGSGDGNLTNIVLRSVNNAGSQWSHAQYRAQSHQFQFQGTTKVNINSNGLCFNSDTAATNALDDYEEGNHSHADYSGASLTLSYSNSGRYTKIGRMVYVTFDVTYPSNSDNNLARLQAPFNADFPYGSGWVGWTELGRPMSIHVSGLSVYLMDNNSSGTAKHLYNSELSGKRVIGGYILNTNA